MRQGLFLDRDGVINYDHGYVHTIEKFAIRPGILEIIRAAYIRGFVNVVVTNQAGIGRGYYTLDQFRMLDSHMHAWFAEQGAPIAKTFFCPYHPLYGQGHLRQRSFHRKPAAGMLVEACNEFNINPQLSLMIGDKESDRQAAEAVGVPRFIDARHPNWIKSALEALNF
jgi:D-glycero-D-manno-heptose 1,7-bisphosphate phosphatase